MGVFKRTGTWLWLASKGIRIRLFCDCILGLVRIAAGLSFIYVSKLLVDMATHTQSSSIRGIYFYSFILVVLLAIELVSSIFATWLSNQTEIRMKNSIRSRLFAHLMKSYWDGREHFHSGDVINRLEEDARVVTDAICQSFPSLIVTLVQLLAAFLFLEHLNALLAWSIILIMPFFLLISKLYITKMRKLTSDIRNTDSKVQSLLQESLQHRIVIKSMERCTTMIDRLVNLQTGLYRKVMKRTRFNLFSRTMISIGFTAGYLTVFIWSILQLHEGLITFGVMTAFLQLVGQIQRPTVDLTRQIPAFIHASTSIDRLREIEDIPTETLADPNSLSGSVGIRLLNLTFRYPGGDKDVLHRFSYDFLPGSRTAIIGETGSGKSTMVRLILSLLIPIEGHIELYNDTGTKINADARSRCNLIYVPQGNTLLSGTIRDNLLLGNPNADDAMMKEVLHIAAADFVDSLPNKLDTVCGEQGTGLSEGQAQRISIARGLLRPGNLLLLDEFSSSLDKETEQLLIERLMNHCKDKTMIFITHREAIIKYCDHVLKLVR